jgi:1-pyrroline-5-carboxylate dehydrogenase
MFDAIPSTPSPVNEPQLSYAPGSAERAALKGELARQAARTLDLPLVIGGKDVTTGRLVDVRAPHKKELLLGRAHAAGPEEITRAIDAANAAHAGWAATPWTTRAAVFLKAADLLATKYRPILNAATMLGQSKTAYQAEIDSACELIDFFRFNVHYARRIALEQPESPRGTWNLLEPRPLEGFVFAVTPFNFTAIAGNLPSAPAILGNTVVWKPASSALLSAHFIMEIWREAGLPDGVINLVQGPANEISRACLAHPSLAGIHFTGSTPVFNGMWKTVGENVGSYKGYPRLVGETGGKDFVFAHESADVDALAVALVRGAFEYQGQKCSAASRAYVPRSLWPALRERVTGMMDALRMGDVMDFRNFVGAVIDAKAYRTIGEYVKLAKSDPKCTIVRGGGMRDTDGWFIEPTLVETTDPRHKLMQEEIFGPVLTLYVYADEDEDAALRLCDETSPYALTGALFARDRAFLDKASAALRYTAGNLYLNDKPTGAVVGQQPFGGARGSGTNDKAGSLLNLYRWVSPRAIKENFVPPTSVGYPFMEAE